MLVLALVVRLILIIPLILIIIFYSTDYVRFSGSLETFVFESPMYHLLLIIISFVLIPLLIYLLIKHEYKSIKIKYICYFLLYYSLLNIPTVFVEYFLLAKYNLGS